MRILHTHMPRAQQGFSIVELLVGVAVGLLVTAAATLLITHQLHESRSLQLEARLMQDLRTASDLVARDLRRAGYWADATHGVWQHSAAPLPPNPYSALSPENAASSAVSFGYSRDGAENNAVDANERLGFRLRQGVVEAQLGQGNWQALTDPAVLTITQLSVTPQVQEIPLQHLCTTPCPAGSAICPPRQQVRSLETVLSGQSRTDARVRRTLRATVRLRNDLITGACAA